jgi:hypothetical protein
MISLMQDEYFGKAIGIRSPRAKLQLILVDVFFIILNSADLALAFNVLYDSEAGCLSDANAYDVLPWPSNADIRPRTGRLCVNYNNRWRVFYL